MYTVKTREKEFSINEGSYQTFSLSLPKTDREYETLIEASDRVNYLIDILPYGTEIFIYENERLVEKHIIPTPRPIQIPMTIGNLIEKLQTYPPDHLVMTPGWEGGWSFLTLDTFQYKSIKEKKLEDKRDHYGDYDIVEESEIKAVLLGQENW